MGFEIVAVKSKSDLKKFVMLPWKIYKGNKCWVPPLIKEMMNSLDPKKNPSLIDGSHEMFLALLDNVPVGRILAGFDAVLNEKKNTGMGFFSLFECIDDFDAAKALFDSSVCWLKDRNITLVRGPVSPTGADNDENKGLLIDCFDRPPLIMNSYNPPYYQSLIEKYGFIKNYDVYAYFFESSEASFDKTEKVIEYAKKRYNFRVDTLNLKNVEDEIKALKYVLDLAVPDEWPDLVAPSLEEVRHMAQKLIPVADPDIILIARSGDVPIGFGISLPDYNQVLIHLNGRVTPLGALKYLWYKRKINCIRSFIIFVIPSFRSKGVSYALYNYGLKNAISKGYTSVEASTIGETNIRMRNDVESFGGKHYKTYRIFGMEI